MDSSIFKENQTQFSIFTDPNANWNDQPVDYGPLVFKVMDAVSKRLGGVEYLIGESPTLGIQLGWRLNIRLRDARARETCYIGLSLRNPSDPMISQLAASAQSLLGDELDAYLLGNVSVQVTDHPKDCFSDPSLGDQTGTRPLHSPW